MGANPGTSVVEVLAAVVTYNSARVVGDLLDSLPDAMAGLAYRVVIVDNGSQDGTAEAVEESVDLLLRGENIGYAAAINAAVDFALTSGIRPESVLVLNPDVVMAPRSVSVMLDELRRTGAGVVLSLIHI